MTAEAENPELFASLQQGQAQRSTDTTMQGVRRAMGLNITDAGITGTSVVHKFGCNPAATTSWAPVTRGGIYRTPQVAGAVALRVKAGGNANDTAAGTGAREVTFQGLDETGALVEEAVATAGASASASTTTTFIRLFRAWVSASGTYASATAGSHAASIVIEDASPQDWATIAVDGFAMSQTQIAAYSVPLGKTAYVQSMIVQVDATKPADMLFFQRQNILETAAPYTAMRDVIQLDEVESLSNIRPFSPLGPFPALTDIGWMAKVGAGTGVIVADFEIILVDTP